MNQLNDITDEDFVPFLHKLGVDTYKKSFEWLLNDPDFAGVLRWMYHNLDENNALTAREEYRYSELEKKEKLLSASDLDNKVQVIKTQFEGLCLPGDKHGLADVKMDIMTLKERLAMLNKQETMLQDLTAKNEQIKEDVTLELSHLNAAQQQSLQDEKALVEECVKFADDIENITDSVMDVISNALDQYTNTQTDRELSKKFFTFGPFESYRQSQALFRSHFDLFTTKKFIKRQHDSVSVEELRAVLTEARNLEERLTRAAITYIEAKAELSGEQAKLALVANHTPIHPSQVTIATMEAQSALELLEQEEQVTMQQLHAAIKTMVDGRTRMAVDTTVKAAIAVREQIHSELLHLHDITQQALSLDRALYCALRHELRTIEELLQFSAHLWRHYVEEKQAVGKRIELMSEICSEQESCEERLCNSDGLLQILCKMLNLPDTNDMSVIIKVYSELKNRLKELKVNVQDGLNEKENYLASIAKSSSVLLSARFTSTPVVNSLIHKLTADIKQTDQQVLNATDTFSSVKKGDKQNLRKLWQWFLTDQHKLTAALKEVSPKSY